MDVGAKPLGLRIHEPPFARRAPALARSLATLDAV